MKSKELKEKLNKALENVEKRKKTIERHKQQAEKKLNIIQKNGWEKGLENDSCFRGDNYNYEALDAICNYKWKLDDIKNTERKLADAECVAKNWQEKLERQLEIERKMIHEIPLSMMDARNELVEEWVKYDIKCRDKMLKDKKELSSYDEFRRIYKYNDEERLKHTDDEFRRIEEREADYWVIDLYNRVYAITGKITDCSSLKYIGKSLNGFLVGENGKAEVETIIAGGYNIQRLHYRVLVKEVK